MLIVQVIVWAIVWRVFRKKGLISFLTVLSILYFAIAFFYTILLWALAEPEFKWSSQVSNLIILYAIPGVILLVRTVLWFIKSRRNASGRVKL